MTDATCNSRLSQHRTPWLVRVWRALLIPLKWIKSEHVQQLADEDLNNLPNSVKRDMGWPDRHMFRRK